MMPTLGFDGAKPLCRKHSNAFALEPELAECEGARSTGDDPASAAPVESAHGPNLDQRLPE